MSIRLRGATALVTGGTGFIGSRLVDRLLREGCRVHLFARRPSAASVQGCHLGDARDAKAAGSAVAASDPQFVFSLAAIRDAGPGRPAADLEAANALVAALAGRARRLRRWVRTGFRLGGGIDELFEQEFDRRVRSKFGLPLTTLRLFRVYGPGQPSGELIPSLLRQASRSPRVVVPDVGCVDLVHVDDVVDAYLRAASSGGDAARPLEIGGGELLSPSMVGRRVLEAIGSGKPLAAPIESPANGHPARIEVALEALGWRPKVSLRNGVRRLWSDLEKVR